MGITLSIFADVYSISKASNLASQVHLDVPCLKHFFHPLRLRNCILILSEPPVLQVDLLAQSLSLEVLRAAGTPRLCVCVVRALGHCCTVQVLLL